MSRIAIVGGGIAGLSAAFHLSKYHQVTIFEAEKQLGGRTRCTAFDQLIVDHGYHTISTADNSLIELTQTLNINISESFSRHPCKFHIVSEQHPPQQFRLRDTARPFNLLAAIVRIRHISSREKIRALHFAYRCLYRNPKLSPEVTLDALLIRYRQNGRMKDWLWEPLSLYLLNTPSRHTSAALFTRTLRQFFFNQERQTHLLLPRKPLCKSLIEPMTHAIENADGRILLNHKVSRVLFNDDGITGLEVNGKQLEFDHVVIATNPHQSAHLLGIHSITQSITRDLSLFRYEPLTTIYFSYAQSTRLEQAVNLFSGLTSQWLIDISPSGDEGLVAVTITGNGPHMSMNDEDLASHVHQELRRNLAGLSEPESFRIIREKTTHLAASTDVERSRPRHETGLTGLWLCGYYCQTGVATTTESAIKSGAIIANQIPRS